MGLHLTYASNMMQTLSFFEPNSKGLSLEHGSFISKKGFYGSFQQENLGAVVDTIDIVKEH